MSCIDNEPVCMAGNPHDYVSMIGHQLTYLVSLGGVNVVVTAGRAREWVPFLKMLRAAMVPMM